MTFSINSDAIFIGDFPDSSWLFISIGTCPNDLVEGFKICTPIQSGMFMLD